MHVADESFVATGGGTLQEVVDLGYVYVGCYGIYRPPIT